MTTFQDPQPQSRRAVRQSERSESAESTVGFTEFPPTPAPAAPQFYSDPDAPRDMWDTTARRAAQLPPAAPATTAAPAPDAAPAASGRRSASGPTPAQPAGEPLTYSTQSRPNVPSYDGPSFRARPTPELPLDDDLAPTQAIPKSDQPAYRVRDFSPEGRRAAPTAPAWNAPAPVVPEPIAHVPAAIAAVETPASDSPDEFHERTLTRREMRALEEARKQANPGEEQVVPVALAAAAAFVAPSVVEPEVAEPEAASEAVTAWPFTGLVPATLAPEPTTNTALNDAIAEFDALTQESEVETPAPESRVIEETPTSVWTAPIGHWSTQAGLDDESQPHESTINRTVGSGTVTTNALVLPTIPEGSDIRGPLTGTGEIMLTGSIDLPQSYSSTGASSRVEHHGIDALFDLHDAEVVTTDSQPVRAISAVSTHNSGQGVTHTQKPKGTRALTALVISAASMAVVVVGLLVAVFALNIF